jgi:hypothetical protein
MTRSTWPRCPDEDGTAAYALSTGLGTGQASALVAAVAIPSRTHAVGARSSDRRRERSGIDEQAYKGALILLYEQGALVNFRDLFVEQLRFAASNYFL